MPMNELEMFLSARDREAENTLRVLRALPLTEYDSRRIQEVDTGSCSEVGLRQGFADLITVENVGTQSASNALGSVSRIAWLFGTISATG